MGLECSGVISRLLCCKAKSAGASHGNNLLPILTPTFGTKGITFSVELELKLQQLIEASMLHVLFLDHGYLRSDILFDISI